MRSRLSELLKIRRGRRTILPAYWRRHPWLTAVLAVVVLAGIVTRRSTGPASTASDYARYHRKTFRVSNVVDGDTVDLAVRDGRRSNTRVRLWGVDTPEVAGSGRGEMVFGPEASAFTKSELLGCDVEAWLVEGRTRDRYGRLLAYLKRSEDDVTFNERLVATGHAYADWRFHHPYEDRFKQGEKRARRERNGLWAVITPEQMPGWRQRMARGSASARKADRSRTTSTAPH